MEIGHVESEEHYDKTLEENDYVFMIYSAGWCGPCRSFKKWLSEEYPSYPYPILIVDVEKLDELADDVSALPTMKVFHNKEVVIRTEGFDKQKLKPVFDSYLDKSTVS